MLSCVGIKSRAKVVTGRVLQPLASWHLLLSPISPMCMDHRMQPRIQPILGGENLYKFQGRSREQLRSQCFLSKPRKFDFSDESRSPGPGILPSDVIEDGIDMYFEHFHAQPYALLCQATTTRATASISPVVLNPMLALSIRCSSHPFWTDPSKLNSWLQYLTDRAWKDLLQLYGDGDTGLQYLQGLCLLAQVDFAGMCKLYTMNLYIGFSNLSYCRWSCEESPLSTLVRHQNRPVIWIFD